MSASGTSASGTSASGTLAVERGRQLLLVATAGMGIGMVLLMRIGTAIGSRLFMDEQLVHPQAVAVERGLATLGAVAVVSLLVPRLRMIASAVLLLLAATLAWATMDQGGSPFSDWAFVSHAMRMGAPLALLLSVAAKWEGADSLPRAAVAVLYGSTALVFVMHGVEALRAHPFFVDLTITAAREVMGLSLTQSTVQRMLFVVGVVDIAVAVALLRRQSRAVAAWMALWGGGTALLRMLAYGSGALGETLVRTPHAVLPLVILVAATRTLQRD